MRNKILTGIALLLPLSFSMAKESTASQLCLLDSESKQEACLDKLYKEEDHKLNTTYTQLIKLVDPKTKIQIRTMQRAWIAQRDDICIYNIDRDNNTKQCLIDETHKQTNNLEKKITKYSDAFNKFPPKKSFEGTWEHCFYLNEQNEEICTINYITQDDNKISGKYEMFESYQYKEIKYVGTISEENSQLADITECLDTANEKTFICTDGQDNNKKYKLLLCNNNFLYFIENDEISCDTLDYVLNSPYIRLYDSQAISKEH